MGDPEILAQELADAAAAGVAPIDAGTRAFEEALTNGGEYLWVVGADGRLRIIPEVSSKIKHSVLFNGEDVQGAGNVTFANGKLARITDQSGHYFPWFAEDTSSFLQSGVDSFRRLGVVFEDGAIQPHSEW